MRVKVFHFARRIIAAVVSFSLIAPSPAYALRSPSLRTEAPGAQKNRAELRQALEGLGIEMQPFDVARGNRKTSVTSQKLALPVRQTDGAIRPDGLRRRRNGLHQTLRRTGRSQVTRVRSEIRSTVKQKMIASPDQSLMAQEDASLASNILAPFEQEILRIKFGLEGHKYSSIEDVARRYGVTSNRIYQIGEEALMKLKRYVAEDPGVTPESLIKAVEGMGSRTIAQEFEMDELKLPLALESKLLKLNIRTIPDLENHTVEQLLIGGIGLTGIGLSEIAFLQKTLASRGSGLKGLKGFGPEWKIAFREDLFPGDRFYHPELKKLHPSAAYFLIGWQVIKGRRGFILKAVGKDGKEGQGFSVSYSFPRTPIPHMQGGIVNPASWRRYAEADLNQIQLQGEVSNPEIELLIGSKAYRIDNHAADLVLALRRSNIPAILRQTNGLIQITLPNNRPSLFWFEELLKGHRFDSKVYHQFQEAVYLNLAYNKYNASDRPNGPVRKRSEVREPEVVINEFLTEIQKVDDYDSALKRLSGAENQILASQEVFDRVLEISDLVHNNAIRVLHRFVLANPGLATPRNLDRVVALLDLDTLKTGIDQNAAFEILIACNGMMRANSAMATGMTLARLKEKLKTKGFEGIEGLDRIVKILEGLVNSPETKPTGNPASPAVFQVTATLSIEAMHARPSHNLFQLLEAIKEKLGVLVELDMDGTRPGDVVDLLMMMLMKHSKIVLIGKSLGEQVPGESISAVLNLVKRLLEDADALDPVTTEKRLAISWKDAEVIWKPKYQAYLNEVVVLTARTSTKLDQKQGDGEKQRDVRSEVRSATPRLRRMDAEISVGRMDVGSGTEKKAHPTSNVLRLTDSLRAEVRAPIFDLLTDQKSKRPRRDFLRVSGAALISFVAAGLAGCSVSYAQKSKKSQSVFRADQFAKRLGIPEEILKTFYPSLAQAHVVILSPEQMKKLPQAPTIWTLGNAFRFVDFSKMDGLMIKGDEPSDAELIHRILKLIGERPLRPPVFFIRQRAGQALEDLLVVAAHEFSHLEQKETHDLRPFETAATYLQKPSELEAILTSMLVYRLMHPSKMLTDFVRPQIDDLPKEASDAEVYKRIFQNSILLFENAMWTQITLLSFEGTPLNLQNALTIREKVLQKLLPSNTLRAEMRNAVKYHLFQSPYRVDGKTDLEEWMKVNIDDRDTLVQLPYFLMTASWRGSKEDLRERGVDLGELFYELGRPVAISEVVSEQRPKTFYILVSEGNHDKFHSSDADGFSVVWHAASFEKTRAILDYGFFQLPWRITFIDAAFLKSRKVNDGIVLVFKIPNRRLVRTKLSRDEYSLAMDAEMGKRQLPDELKEQFRTGTMNEAAKLLLDAEESGFLTHLGTEYLDIDATLAELKRAPPNDQIQEIQRLLLKLKLDRRASHSGARGTLGDSGQRIAHGQNLNLPPRVLHNRAEARLQNADRGMLNAESKNARFSSQSTIRNPKSKIGARAEVRRSKLAPPERRRAGSPRVSELTSIQDMTDHRRTGSLAHSSAKSRSEVRGKVARPGYFDDPVFTQKLFQSPLLSNKEKHVLRGRFSEGKPLAEVGRELQLSREQIRRIQNYGLRKANRLHETFRREDDNLQPFSDVSGLNKQPDLAPRPIPNKSQSRSESRLVTSSPSAAAHALSVPGLTSGTNGFYVVSSGAIKEGIIPVGGALKLSMVAIANRSELREAIQNYNRTMKPVDAPEVLVAKSALEAVDLARQEIKRLQSAGKISGSAQVHALIMGLLTEDAEELRRILPDAYTNILVLMLERMAGYAGIVSQKLSEWRAQFSAIAASA